MTQQIGTKTMLSIDWDFFIPHDTPLNQEGEAHDVVPSDDEFWYEQAAWLMARGLDPESIVHTNGLEFRFWDDIRTRFDLSQARLYITESHQDSFALGMNIYDVGKVYSFDSHYDLRVDTKELRRTRGKGDSCINRGNWLGALLYLSDRRKSAKLILPNSQIYQARNSARSPAILDSVQIHKYNLFLDYDTVNVPETIDVLHICRSDGSTPHWLDAKFEEFWSALGIEPSVDYRLSGPLCQKRAWDLDKLQQHLALAEDEWALLARLFGHDIRRDRASMIRWYGGKPLQGWAADHDRHTDYTSVSLARLNDRIHWRTVIPRPWLDRTEAYTLGLNRIGYPEILIRVPPSDGDYDVERMLKGVVDVMLSSERRFVAGDAIHANLVDGVLADDVRLPGRLRLAWTGDPL